MSVDPRRARMAARQAAAVPPPSSVPQPSASMPTPDPRTQSPEQPLPAAQPQATQNTSQPIPSVPQPVATLPPQQPQKEDESYKLKFCTVCASNNNRSMEAHLRLSTAENKYPVVSFGTGSFVRLPGPSISQPQVYEFNTTTYDRMYSELEKQDTRLYKANGVLPMLDRNRGIKFGPERFQDWVIGKPRLDAVDRGDKGASGAEGGVVDVIFTCEERCWDAVVENLHERGAPLNRPVHVFNVDIRDNHEEALVGGRAILELADTLNEAASQERHNHGVNGWQNGNGMARASFDERVPDILAEWSVKWPNLPALWTLSWL